MPAPGAASQGQPHELHEEGGEAVCWLERVCEGCGALREGRPDAPCGACGAPPGAPD